MNNVVELPSIKGLSSKQAWLVRIAVRYFQTLADALATESKQPGPRIVYFEDSMGKAEPLLFTGERCEVVRQLANARQGPAYIAPAPDKTGVHFYVATPGGRTADYIPWSAISAQHQIQQRKAFRNDE